MAKNSKLSKMAANRLAVSATVTSSATVHGAEIAEALHAALFPDGSQKLEVTRKFLGALGGFLDRAAAGVEAADLAHASELLDDEEPRQRRDAALAELTAVLLGQRATLDTLYGPQTTRIYGLAEPLPTQPSQLLQRARSVAKQLRDKPITAKPLRRGLTLKGSELAGELDEAIEKLADALADVQRETREAQLTQEQKHQATDRWQAAYQGVTYAFYGLYLLAGRKDLAERIEPTARRRAGLPEPEDNKDPEANEDAEDAEAQPTPTPTPLTP